jgi:hypothetical protein
MRRWSVQAVYGFYTAGAVRSYGTGCAGSGGRVVQSVGNTLPELGQQPTYGLSAAPPNSAALLALGFSDKTWAGVPLPLRLPGTLCDVLTELVITYATATNGRGDGRVDLSLPNDSSLIGASYFTQFWCIDLPANPIGLTTSNGIESRIGGWVLQ